jgi:hypothetical protein
MGFAVGQPDGGADSLDDLDAAMGFVAPKPKPTGIESFARGATQGATVGFADEFVGAATAAGRKLGDAFFGLPNQPSYGVRYRMERDESREANEAAQQANPATYTAGQIGGGLATAIVPGAAPVTLGRAIGVGAAYGAAAGLGDSKADITKGDVAGAAKDTAIGTAVGAISGGAGYGAMRGAGAAYNKLTRRQKLPSGAVENLARKVAGGGDEISDIGKESSVKSFYADSVRLQDDMSEALGKPFRFSPAEATGDPSAALAESLALQSPKSMRGAQSMRSDRLKNTAKFLDHITDGIAANPEKLGKADVAGSFADAVDRHMISLRAVRQEAAGPHYKEADTLLGDKKIAPIDELTSFVMSEIERSPGPFQPSVAALKSTLETLTDSTRGGFASVKTVRALAEKWGQQADGTGDLLKDMSIAQRRFVASKMSEILNRSLDSVAETGPIADAGIIALRKAQQVYRAHSQAIEELPLEALNRVMKVGGGEAGDTLVDRIMTMSDEQLTGVMKVVTKTDPATAQQFRAQVLEHQLVRGGKPERGASIAKEIGAAELKPGQALGQLVKMEPKLRALYAGDNKALATLKQAMQVLQRASVGPGLRGAQSTPLALQALDQAAGNAGGMVSKAWSVAKSILNNDRALARAASTPAGLETIHRAIQVQLGLATGSAIPPRIMNALIVSASLPGLGARDAVATRLEPKEPPMHFAGGKQ